MKTKIFSLITLFLMSVVTTAQVDRSQQPKPGPAPKITIEKPAEFKLNIGLNVLVVENNKLPRVSYSLTLDNGPIKEGNKAGVSSLLSEMLGNGTTSIPKDEFNEEIDFLGATLFFGSTSGYASSLSKYADRIIELMADAAINPLFTEEEFDKAKERLLEGIKADAKSVDAIAGRVGSALSYGKEHPYGEFETEETINNVTFQDVVNFHKTYFIPNNAYMVVVGDITVDKVKEQMETYFTRWAKSQNFINIVTTPSANVAFTHVNFIDVPSAVQSNISVTNNVNLKMGDKDYHAVLMANTILGGGFESYLNMNLREEHGYTYGARSNIGTSRYGVSRFTAGASVRNAVTDSSVVETLKEIKRIKSELVDEEAIKIAKAKYTGNFVMALESPQTIANYALNIKLNNLPDDFYETYLAKINAVTAQDIKRVANKYIEENVRIIVVGNGNDVLENLEKTAIPIRYFDAYANPTEKPKKAEVAEGITAASVLSKYLEAIGGTEKLSKINSLIVKYEASAMGATILNEEKRMRGKVAQNILMNGAPMMSAVVTQESSFVKQGGAKQPLPGNMGEDMKNTTGLFVEQTILQNGTAKLSGTESVEGKDAYVVEVPGESVSLKLYYDIETGLKVKEAQIITMGGQSQVQEALLKDYQAFEGIMFPTVKEADQMGMTIASKLIEVVFNKDVSAADFE